MENQLEGGMTTLAAREDGQGGNPFEGLTVEPPGSL
jgi:hypothetical protein